MISADVEIKSFTGSVENHVDLTSAELYNAPQITRQVAQFLFTRKSPSPLPAIWLARIVSLLPPALRHTFQEGRSLFVKYPRSPSFVKHCCIRTTFTARPSYVSFNFLSYCAAFPP